MALLPNLAGRLNNIEISSGAPVTETLLRRFGSNINLLLDFLGITDGSSVATGDLSDLSQAVSLASSHTMNLVASFPPELSAPSTKVIGTFTKNKYLDQVIYPVLYNNSGFSMSGYSRNVGELSLTLDGVVRTLTTVEPQENLHTFNYLPYGRLFSRKLITDFEQTGGELPTGFRYVFDPVVYISNRDYNTSATLNMNFLTGPGNFTALEFYREYRLNVGSNKF